MSYSTNGALFATRYRSPATGERHAEVRGDLQVQGDLDVQGEITQNGSPLSDGAGGVANEAPAGAIAVTSDEEGNLDGSSALTFNLQTLGLLLQGAGANLGITGNTCSFVMTGQGGDGTLSFKLIGLPRTDPEVEGKLWIDNNGFVRYSEG